MARVFGQLRGELAKHYLLAFSTLIISGVAIVTSAMWNDSIAPRIDRYLLKKIDEYVAGTLQARVARFDPSLEQSQKEYVAFRNKLFNDVDAVYSIAFTFRQSDLQGTHPKRWADTLIYADPKRHRIHLTLFSTKSGSTFSLRINSAEYKIAGQDFFSKVDEDITQFILDNPHKGTAGGFVSEAAATGVETAPPSPPYAPYTSVISVGPALEVLSTASATDESIVAAVQGYALVTRIDPVGQR